jgi:hypothetical protein
MPNPNPETYQLHGFTAPDTDGGTVPISGRIPPDLKLWLQSIPGGTSFHLRQAVRLYEIWMDRKAGDWEAFEQQCRESGLMG